MRQPWPHKPKKLMKASTPPALPPTAEHSTNDDVNLSRGSYLPSPLVDSVRSEDSTFYLPFDEDEEERLSQPSPTRDQQETPSSSTLAKQSLLASIQEKQKQQNDAIALLGGFFLGEVVETSSTLAASIANDSPKSVMLFGEGRKETFQQPKSEAKDDMIDHVMNALSSATPPEATLPPKTQHHSFAMLTKGDRANSMPLESAYRSPQPLTKRPSLKKISSIGKFPTSRSDHSFKRNVSFSKLSIREYNVAISDHPSCSYGPPVQLSWDYKEKDEMQVDCYEETRQPRREIDELVLSYYDRRYMLLKQGGYSKREVKEAVMEVERVKRERMVTDIFLPASPLEETIGSVVDSVKGFFQRKQADV